MGRKRIHAPTTSRQVTFRMPEDLYQKLKKIADSIYQSPPVVFRMALAEFAKNHRPARHGHTGISIVFPLQDKPPLQSDHVTTDDTPLSPDESTS